MEIRIINENERVIHIYGKPGTGKTTLAITLAMEVHPFPVYYFITSQYLSVIKRMQQIINRKSHVKIADSIYPIKIDSLEDMAYKLKKLKAKGKKSLIIIDYISDFAKASLYKEEVRQQLRSILELLYNIAEQNKARIVLINSVSYKGEATGDDLIESFSDLTIKLTLKKRRYNDFIRELMVNESQSYNFSIGPEGISQISFFVIL